ncbi:Uncharacterised protein [Mycobacteroides abscessus subsp. abscessus]|nr:Uncharacterised protein [Mycobacteroides abscessus subsp. abscessus]
MCPGLYGYRFSTAYTSSPRAMISPSSSDILGMSVNGWPVASVGREPAASVM